jgi:hypothetical protein
MQYTVSVIALLGLLPANVFTTPTLISRNAVESIKWKSCEDYVQKDAVLPVTCANISVPLDYTDKKSNATHTLELIKVAASTKSPKGSVIMNFGGPGADGLHTLAAGANVYRESVVSCLFRRRSC